MTVEPWDHSARCAHRARIRNLILLTTIACGYFVARKLHQYAAFQVAGELADFESIVWNTLQGRFFLKSPAQISFFSEHFSPILLVLAPLYALFRSPVVLLIVQAVAAAAAVIPLYLLAVRWLKSDAIATAVSVAYIVSWLVQRGLMYDFHMEIFYPVLFLWALWASAARRWWVFFPMLLLALAVKEDAGLAALGLGGYLLVSRRQRQGLAVIGIAVLYLALVCGFVIPHFRAGGPKPSYAFLGYWSGYGTSAREIATHMLDPLRHAAVLGTGPKLAKTLTLFSSFLFLPLLSWRAFVFLVLPNWFVLFSSDHELLYSISIYYGLLLTPFLFCATLVSLARIQHRWESRFHWLLPALVALWLLVSLGNSSLSKHVQPAYWNVAARTRTARHLIAAIPRQASVSAQVSLVSHLPVRTERYLLPRGIDRAAYLLFDTQTQPWPLTPRENEALLDSLRQTGAWVTQAERDGFVLLRRCDP